MVFGAAFSHDFKSVEHISVESKDELYRLRGSKYLQSSIKDSYKRAKEFAEKGRMVLFSGTPCQIAGLYGYLGKDYENLYTQDIVCHGVPSPVVWSKYVDWREHEASSKTREISFRNKSKGWASYSLHFSFENGSEYSQTVTNDLYLRGFVSNVYLRPSCYNCSFKGKERPADITLADFWGVDRVVEGFNDKKGTSLIILGSPKGKKLLDLNRQKIRLKEADINRAIAFNSAAVKSSLCPKTRREFFAKLGEVPYSKLMEKYCGIKFREKVKRKIKQLIKK